jgi:hypothetical protein
MNRNLSLRDNLFPYLSTSLKQDKDILCNFSITLGNILSLAPSVIARGLNGCEAEPKQTRKPVVEKSEDSGRT